jgi:hypothetical protein
MPQAESAVRREILALYDGGREAQPDETLIRKLRRCR